MDRRTAILGIGGIIVNPLVLLASPTETPAVLWKEKVPKLLKLRGKACIKYGERKHGRGHTLFGIYWMESWFGSDVDHEDEDSIGDFAIRPGTGARTLIQHGLKVPYNLERRLKEFHYSADLANLIIGDNIDYFLRKGWDPGAAWRFAYQRYVFGKKWRRAGKKGRVYSERVKFAKTIPLV